MRALVSALLVLGAVVDLLSTELALARGGTEVNIFLRSQYVRVIAKVVALVFAFWGAARMTPAYPTGTVVALGIAATIWWGAATWNFTQIARSKRR